jgi:hypothetical protein
MIDLAGLRLIAAYHMRGHPILFVKQILIKRGYRSLSPFKARRKLALLTLQPIQKERTFLPSLLYLQHSKRE